MKDKKEMMASQDKDRLRHFKRLISVEEPNVAEDSEDTASICMVGRRVNMCGRQDWGKFLGKENGKERI